MDAAPWVTSINFLSGFAQYCVLNTNEIILGDDIVHFDCDDEPVTESADWTSIDYLVAGPCKLGLFYTCYINEWEVKPLN